MAFLCGRPGCGRESTATLQIDAVAAVVSLVDPRVSREGVALCAAHADSTTPPLGWAMNDLRSTARVLGLDGDVEPTVTATPPRVRPAGEVGRPGDRDGSEPDGRRSQDGAGGRNGRMPRRQSILDRVRQDSPEFEDGQDDKTVGGRRRSAGGDVAASVETAPGRESNERFIARSLERRRTGRPSNPDAAPDSRPSRRREMAEEQPEEDRFPWHYTFDDDDEPAELQASTPLLSRAFRSTTG